MGANFWSLTTTPGTAFILPATAPVGYELHCYNLGGATALIYPATGGTIQGGATNASFSIAANKVATSSRWQR